MLVTSISESNSKVNEHVVTTQQNTKEVKTKVEDVVVATDAPDPELSHIVTTPMDPNLALDNQPIEENLETKNDFDDKQYDIPDEGTPFDEDDDKIK